MGPGGAAGARQPLLELALDALEARAQELGVLRHMLAHGVERGQEAHVHELVELVGGDQADLERAGDLGDVRGRGAEECDARTGERDLGGGGDGEDAVLVAGLARAVEDVRELLGLLAEIVHGVGVVPHDAEIGGGALHGSQAADRLVRIGHTGGDAEHALDGGIRRHEALDLIHVGAGLGHADGDVLDAEVLGEAEVAVVTGGGAQPLHAVELVPGGVAGNALLPVVHDDVLHDVEAGGAEHDGLLGGDAQELAGELARGRDSLEAAVVGAVHAFIGEVGGGAQEVEHGDVHLRGRGLAAGHVELEAARLDLGDAGLEVLDRRGELGVVHLLIHRLHDGPFSRLSEKAVTATAPRRCVASLRNSIRGLPGAAP